MLISGHPISAGRQRLVLGMVLGLYVGLVLSIYLVCSAIAARAAVTPVLPAMLRAVGLGAPIFLATIPVIVISIRRELHRRSQPPVLQRGQPLVPRPGRRLPPPLRRDF
jgi:hypothetical protein